MKYQLLICAFVLAIVFAAPAQMASHAPSHTAAKTNPAPPVQADDGKVAVVNGTVLTNRDLVREMYMIFPYAEQHGGKFPKEQEAGIRQGALQMIIFEELVFQEAMQRKLAVSAEKLNAAESDFRKQFKSPEDYQQYLQHEMHGSTAELRRKIRRSLLIERMLKIEVENKSVISVAEVKAYYDKNPARFEVPEAFSFQSISIVPPFKPTAEQAKDAQQKAEAALKQAKAASNYEDFGLLAEKISEDDFRVNMGDHHAVDRQKLPPQVVKALTSMKVGQVSNLIPIESAYTIVRLNAHTLAHKKSLQEVRKDLQLELQKNKYESLRSALDKQLRAKAKIELS